jgi:hypothetical protein
MEQRVNLFHGVVRGVRHMALHAALCFMLALFFGWLEIQIRIAAAGPGAANEFVGMAFVVWAYFIGPVACLLAAPAHLVAYLSKKPGLHLYSVAASVASCVGVWVFLWVLTRDAGQSVALT